MPEFRIRPTKPQYDIIFSSQQINLFLAGQGSGKTQCAGVVSGRLIVQFPQVHGFIGANTYTQLSDSTLFRIRNVWKEYFGWTEYSKSNPSGVYVVDVMPPDHFSTVGHEYDSYHGKICFKSGTVIFKGSLDNYKAHDGKEFAWAILDETKDTKEEAVKEVILGRLREHGMYIGADGSLTQSAGRPFNPLYIFTSPAKVPWINDWFRLDDYHDDIVKRIYSETDYFSQRIENKMVVISSAYHNRANLPANYLENQKLNLHSGLQDMLIYGNPFSQAGGEFYKCFVRNKHVKDVAAVFPDFAGYSNGPYNPKLPIHVSYDFNVHPYMTITIWQILTEKEKRIAIQIGEICMPNPRNTTADASREFVRRYNNHQAGVFYYGDPSGKKEDTRTEKGHNDFLIIRRELGKFNPSPRIDEAAPPVVARGNFINTILENGYMGIEIVIDDRCKNSIADFQYLKEAADGTKLKEKVKNPDTLVTYEKWGHTSDASDYFLCRAFAREFAVYQKGGLNLKTDYGRPKPSKNTY